MAQEFSVSIDLTQLTKLNSLTAVFPNLARSIETIAQEGVVRWQEAVAKVPGLWSGERSRYAATIAARQVGPYAWEVYSDYKFVEDIESGRPPYDLKKMLDTSMKVRVSKAGRRYLVIPMRQNSPGNTAHAPAMSDDVYAEAKQLSHSRVTGAGNRDFFTKEPPGRSRGRPKICLGRQSPSGLDSQACRSPQDGSSGRHGPLQGEDRREFVPHI
jgi:hypothetical protein